MNKSAHNFLKALWLALISAMMFFTLAFAQMAIAQRGGGAGGGGHGGGMRGGSSGPSMRGGPGAGTRTVSPGMRGWGTAPRAAPNMGMPRGGGRSIGNVPMGRGPSMGAPRGGPSFGRGPSMRSPSFTTPQTRTVVPGMRGWGTAPRTAPNMSMPRGNMPTGVPGRQFTPGMRGAGPNREMGVPSGTVTPRTPGQFREGRFGPGTGQWTTPGAGRPERGVGTPRQTPGTPGEFQRRGGETPRMGRGRGPATPGQVPGVTPRQGGPGTREGIGAQRTPGQRRGVGESGRVPGRTERGFRDGRGFGPSQARQQWSEGRRRHGGSWNHQGNWSGHNNHWDWNNSSFSFGFFFYPGFAASFNYGYWGFDYCGAYCSYSPFYYYGLPYVYAPRAVVVDVPTYTYVPVPDYAYGNNYYLSQGSYSGLNVALEDIRTGWVSNRPDLILKHVNAGTQVAIYLDNNYAYSLSGSDYRSMVNDAIKHINTVSFTINNIEQRSDGAYTAIGTHDFYDINNTHKVVSVTYTLAQQGGNWIIIAAGSSEGS